VITPTIIMYEGLQAFEAPACEAGALDAVAAMQKLASFLER